MQRHPQAPWIVYGNGPQPGTVVVQDTRTGQALVARNELEMNQAFARFSAAPGRMGAGDVVKAATERLGIQQCTPCAKRQAAMNRMLPNLWRR